MQESSSSAPAEGVAPYVGIDWADQNHDVILRAASEPTKVEYRRIAHQPDAWSGSVSCSNALLERAKFWLLWSRVAGL